MPWQSRVKRFQESGDGLCFKWYREVQKDCTLRKGCKSQNSFPMELPVIENPGFLPTQRS